MLPPSTTKLASLGTLALLLHPILALPAPEADLDATPTITEAPDLALLRPRADPTAPWVSVDDEGRPGATLTPFMTTDNEGTSYLRDAAPHDLTASVYTFTYYGKVSTSTGEPPNPSATSKNKEGGFPRCYNMDGDNAPLCAPAVDSTLYQDSTYYVTWDPDFFNKTDSSIPSNSTIEVSLRLDYFNRTKENSDDGETLKLDETDRVPASWGMFPLKIKGSHLKGYRPHNVTITLMTNIKGSADKNESTALNVLFDKHRTPPPELSHGPNQRDLIIALPVVFGTIFFITIGLCLWNRKTRRIQLGNVMSRSRNGYTGRAARRMLNTHHKDDGIRLHETPARPHSPVFEYRDHVTQQQEQQQQADHRPRRDSDLGSLAGSPTTPTFGPQSGTGGRSNAFRDELRRQDQQKRNERDMY